MPLTTNTTVWKILSVMFLALTALFGMFYYFRSIFITFVIGMALILMAEAMSKEIEHKVTKRKYPIWKRQLYKYGHIIFWSIILVVIIVAQLADVTKLAQESSFRNLSLGAVEQMLPVIPGVEYSIEDIAIFLGRYLMNMLTNAISQITAVAFNSILIIPVMFYLYFTRRHAIWQFMVDAVPRKFRQGFISASKKMTHQLTTFFTAKLIESIVIAAICSIGFYIIGLKGWLFLGALAGFLNIIPYLGPIISTIPPVLIGLLDSPWTAAFAIIVIGIAQLVDNLYLVPFMVSNKVKVEPLISIVLILGGARLFGVFGMVFAIPIFLVYKVVLTETYRQLVKIYPERKR